MHFQVRTDNHIENSAALAEQVRAEVEGALLPRFANQLRRVEVYLQDTNSHKGGVDTRCAIEAHMAGHQPVAVNAHASTVEEAVDAAVERLLRALEHTFDRLADSHGRTSMSGNDT